MRRRHRPGTGSERESLTCPREEAAEAIQAIRSADHAEGTLIALKRRSAASGLSAGSAIQEPGDVINQSCVRDEYLLSDLTGRIIKAAKAVHSELGPGFEGLIYQRALALELAGGNLDFSCEVWIDVLYREKRVGRKRVDFIIGDRTGDVLVEIKAKAALDDVDFVQTLSYLKASGKQVALLLNFGVKDLGIKRFVYEKARR